MNLDEALHIRSINLQYSKVDVRTINQVPVRWHMVGGGNMCKNNVFFCFLSSRHNILCAPLRGRETLSM